MLYKARQIEQPMSGKYRERIYDIKNQWNSGDWSWVEFEEDEDLWCGQFRGEFAGTALSPKLGIAVILTSDFMYILDINTSDLIDYKSRPMYIEITATPAGDILVTNGYGVEKIIGKTADTMSIEMPLEPDQLHFIGYDGPFLKVICEECCVWDKHIELLLNCDSFEWSEYDQRDPR